ncbi:MAG: hypothetical protein ISS79_01455 [Phycisphaerae bacterium]|nr:hypothetical protein [Phycisphaerae bacterium]
MSRQLCVGLLVLMALGLVAGVVAGESSGASRSAKTGGTKVLHFPSDRSVGKLSVEDEEDESDGWDFFGPAQGDVVVPAGRNIKLFIYMENARADDLSFLSKLGPSDLYELSIQSSIKRTPANRPALESIAHLTDLRALHLSRTGIDGRQMESLRSLTSLRSLSFGEEHSFGSAGLAALKNFPALEYLDCGPRPIDAGLKHLAQLPNLQRLRLRMGGIRGPGLAYLADMPRLDNLILWGSPLSDLHVRYLEGLTGLKRLTLWGGDGPFTDATLGSVGKLASLEEFHLINVGPGFTEVGMERLRGLKNLKKIEYSGISAFNIDGAGMRHLCSLPSLESLKGVWLFSDGLEALASCGNLKCLNVRLGRLGERWGGSVADVGHIAALGSLEELDASGRGLLDEDIARLASLSRLKRLSVWTGDLTERGWASIGELGQLESLHMSTGEITDHSFEAVGKLGKLESLKISGNEKGRVTKRGLNHLNQLTNLQRLELGMSGRTLKPITDDTALNLTAIKNLKGISLTNIGLQGSDWAFLAGFEDLEYIFMNQCGICPQNGLRYIKDLPQLTRLDLQNVNCTQGNGLAVMGGLKSISSIRLMGRITDNALQRVPALPLVQQFSVTTDVAIRPETIAHLKQVLPNVRNVIVRQPSQSSRTMMQPAPQNRGETRSAPQRRSSTRTRRTSGQRTRRRTNR